MIAADFMVWPLCLAALGTAVLLGNIIYSRVANSEVYDDACCHGNTLVPL